MTSENASLVHGSACAVRRRILMRYSSALPGVALSCGATIGAIPLVAEKWDRRSSPRPISTAQLKELLLLHPRPINQLISLGSYLVNPVGDLILGWASCLDAFSAYPIRTWLPSDALGRTTGALAVRPTRSSRTKVSSPQISCAHSGYDPNCLTTF